MLLSVEGNLVWNRLISPLNSNGDRKRSIVNPKCPAAQFPSLLWEAREDRVRVGPGRLGVRFRVFVCMRAGFLRWVISASADSPRSWNRSKPQLFRPAVGHQSSSPSSSEVRRERIFFFRLKLTRGDYRSSHSAMSFQEALAGGLGGLVASICVYPLDVAKTHLQVQSGQKLFSRSYTDQELQHSNRYENETSRQRIHKENDKQDPSQNAFERNNDLLDAIRFVVKREGWIGLYAGVVPSACKGMVASYIFNYLYSFLRPFFAAMEWKISSLISFRMTRHDRAGNHKMWQLQHLSRSTKSKKFVSVLMPSILAIAHGTFAACLTQVLILPLDMIVTRMQLRTDSKMDHQMIDKEKGRLDFHVACCDSPCRICEMNNAERIRRHANDKYDALSSKKSENTIDDIVEENADQPLTSIREENDDIFSHTTVSLFTFYFSRLRSLRPGGFREAVSDIYSEGGFRHFWSSLFPSLLLCLNPGIRQAMQEALRRGKSREKIPSGEIMIHGFLSAAAASLVTYPLSMIKTQLQSSRPTKRVQTRPLRSSPTLPRPVYAIPWLSSISSCSHSPYEAKAAADYCPTNHINVCRRSTVYTIRKSNISIQDDYYHTCRYISGCNARKQQQRPPPVQQSSEEAFINTECYKDKITNNRLIRRTQLQEILEEKQTMFEEHEKDQQESGNNTNFPSYEHCRTKYSNSSSTYPEVCCDNNNNKFEVPSMFQCFSDILRSGGLLSLYQGLFPDLLKKACSEAILVLIRDKLGYFFVLIAFHIRVKRRRQ